MKIGTKKICIIRKGRKMIKAVMFILGFITGMLFIIVVSCRIIAGQVDER